MTAKWRDTAVHNRKVGAGMNWDDLRLLLAVARRGNLLQAGEALGMAPSILSRRITMAEAALVERGPMAPG